MNALTHGSLFSGIGGFDLAARWMNWENVFHVERNPFCTRVLKHHFPESESYEDIYEFQATKYRGRIDVLSGGFPCQPFSTAGKREGTNDERYLWPEMLRVIRDIQPLYIVGENVYGLVNWNAGAVFAEVVSSLETEGYEVGAYVLPASAVEAPHRRDRIFFVAYSDNDRTRRASGEDARASGKERISKRDEIQLSTLSSSVQRFNSDSDSERLARRTEGNATQRREESVKEQFKRRDELRRTNFDLFPSRAAIFSRDDELSARLDGISVSRWRTESVKAYGNAVVPALIYEIFTAIQAFDDAQGR